MIILTAGTVGLVYVFVTFGIHFYALKALVIALSYCYSLILAIYLMGHGLVAIPRELIKYASVSNKLRRLQRKAPRAHDRLLDATSNLEETEAEMAMLRQRKTGSAREFQEWIEELSDIAQLPEASLVSSRHPVRASRTSVPAVITEQYLASFTRRLKLCIHRRARFSAEWQSIVQAAADCQDILNSSTSKRLTFTQYYGSPTLLSKVSVLNSYTRHLLYFHILPIARQGLAILLAIASAFVVWSELVHIFAPKLSLVSLTIIHHPSSTSGQIGFLGQVIAAGWLSYMCLCAYYSLTVVKVWGSYALVPRLTSAASACFYASYAARLTVPLAYNFVTLMPQSISTRTVFFDFLGKLIELTPISERFAEWFPVFILLPVVASLFNLYDRVKGCFGFSGFDVEDEDDDKGAFAIGGWREGHDLIERELNGTSSSRVARPRSPVLSTGSTGPRRLPRYRDDPVAAAVVAANAELDEPDGVFGEFFHRVRNTVDTFEAPRWMRDVEVLRPKWMRGSSNSQ